ncbi:MAG: hypothetical protein MUO31_00975 [Thermodesulfovibrionales bacterium]|nr:hypothetical protein [Thermodesulfovibrionales bacterium]
MAVMTKRRMISRPKKTSAQVLYEQLKRKAVEKKPLPIFKPLTTKEKKTKKKIREWGETVEGWKSRKIGQKIPFLSQVAKQAKGALRHQRKRAIKGTEDIIAGVLPDSSWISELIYFEDEKKVHAMLDGRKYTFYHIEETLFNAWYAGAAATRTQDKQRRWNINDFPSLGAFFNTRIIKWVGSKGKKIRVDLFPSSKGWL